MRSAGARLTTMRLVGKLKPELRMAIVLREYEELSYREIAEVAGCPPGTVKSRLFAARLELRKRLAFLIDDL